MKGHTVPWAFLPHWMQALLALALIGIIVNKTYNDSRVVRRWWPWVSAVATVLLTPVVMRWLGFGPQGVQAKSMAAELQSLASGTPWLKEVVSALQSISTKGMGLKTAGVIFLAGGAFGRLVVLQAYHQLRVMGFIQPRDGDDKGQPEAVQPQDPQAVMQGDAVDRNVQQPGQQHAHDD